VKKVKLEGNAIDISDIQPGFHIVQITESEGLKGSKKIHIQ